MGRLRDLEPGQEFELQGKRYTVCVIEDLYGGPHDKLAMKRPPQTVLVFRLEFGSKIMCLLDGLMAVKPLNIDKSG